MSMYYREHGVIYEPEYERPGRTKQAFKDSCDINKLVAKAQKAGTFSHLEKHGAFYGDFANAPADLFEAREQISRGEEIFKDLPSQIRKDFDNDPLKYFAFVNAPENVDRLHEVLPEIAKPGRYFPDVSPRTGPDGLLGAPVGASTSAPQGTPAGGGEVASGGDSGGDPPS